MFSSKLSYLKLKFCYYWNTLGVTLEGMGKRFWICAYVNSA